MHKGGYEMIEVDGIQAKRKMLYRFQGFRDWQSANGWSHKRLESVFAFKA